MVSGLKDRYVLALIGAVLLLIEANGWLKVPVEEITTLFGITIGTGAAVGFAKHFKK